MAKKEKHIKYPTQNIIDFVISNYGDISYLFKFMDEAGYTNYDDFDNDTSKTLYIEGVDNETTSTYRKESYVVSSISKINNYAQLICNGDLAVKTLVGGDFNDDFNNDFNKDNLETITVGYEGMTIYVTWSVTNNGNISGNVNGTLSLTGKDDIIVSGSVPAFSTTTFTYSFGNVSAGLKTITLDGLCTQTLSIEVLGTVNLVCNADFTLVEALPIYRGDTIHLTWSVTNNGTANGLYENGIFKYSYQTFGQEITVEKALTPVVINAGETHTFNEEVTLNQIIISNGSVIYTFVSSCGQVLTVVAEVPVNIANIVYNNDISLTPLTPQDGDIITVTYSMTNTGGLSGSFTNYLEIYPTDGSLEKVVDTDILNPLQTKVYAHTFTVYACDRSVILSGYSNDSINFNVGYNGIAKYVFWADFNATNPVTPVYSAPFVTSVPNQAVGIHAFLINSTASPLTTPVSFVVKFSSGGSYTALNQNFTVPSSTNCSSGLFITSVLALNLLGTHEVQLYINGIYKGSTYYKIV